MSKREVSYIISVSDRASAGFRKVAEGSRKARREVEGLESAAEDAGDAIEEAFDGDAVEGLSEELDKARRKTRQLGDEAKESGRGFGGMAKEAKKFVKVLAAAEVLEVRASSGGTNTYLNLQTSPVYAQNGNGENVLVRTERYLEWGTNQDNTNAPARTYADMKRLWVRKARQDDSNWRNCTNGTNWNAGISGNVLRVSYAGGRVHLAGQLTYQPYLRVTQKLIDTGYFAGAAQVPAVGTLVQATAAKSIYNQVGVLSEVKQSFELSFVGNTMKLPSGYRPAGDVLVPVLYNGTPACAIVDSDGILTLDRDPEIGDTLKIDTYFEI